MSTKISSITVPHKDAKLRYLISEYMFNICESDPSTWRDSHYDLLMTNADGSNVWGISACWTNNTFRKYWVEKFGDFPLRIADLRMAVEDMQITMYDVTKEFFFKCCVKYLERINEKKE